MFFFIRTLQIVQTLRLIHVSVPIRITFVVKKDNYFFLAGLVNAVLKLSENSGLTEYLDEKFPESSTFTPAHNIDQVDIRLLGTEKGIESTCFWVLILSAYLLLNFAILTFVSWIFRKVPKVKQALEWL